MIGRGRGAARRRLLPESHGLVMKLALRRGFAEPGRLIARAAFFAVGVFVFSRLAYAQPASGGSQLWYLVVAGVIWLTQPRIHVAIERDVRKGELGSAWRRPRAYLGMKLAEAAGELLVAWITLAPVGVLSALALGARAPRDLQALPVVLTLALLASVLILLCHALIGLCAFTLRDVSPLYWIFQQSLFLLGGLVVPLELYPDWLRTLALWSPFSAIVYGPAHLLCAFDRVLALLLLVKLLASIVLVKAGLNAVEARAGVR